MCDRGTGAHPKAACCAETCRRAGPQEAAARRDQGPIVPVPCTGEISHTAAVLWLTLPRHECCSSRGQHYCNTVCKHFCSHLACFTELWGQCECACAL